MYASLARQHRRIFERLVEEAHQIVTVRQPASKALASNGAIKVLGTRPTPATEPVGATQPLSVVWTTSALDTLSLRYMGAPAAIAAFGSADRLDALIRCKLADALFDPSDPQGLTILQTAHDLLYNGHAYKVRVTDRSGLAPEGPYTLWAALKRVDA